MKDAVKARPGSNFRRFFWRGLAILLPSVLTIWILIAAYGFVQGRIAGPINQGVRELTIWVTPWPGVIEDDLVTHEAAVRNDVGLTAAWKSAGYSREWLRRDARRAALANWWQRYAFPMDLIGLVIAVALIYILGAFLGSYLGARLWARGEELLGRIPLIRQVYPSVKQVTEFLVGSGEGEQKIRFNKVVAVEYPRKGLWSVGLVTGDTMRTIQERAGRRCVTVFVPSSPTPFTGYVITVPIEDTIELAVSIEEAMRFTISGGVVVPQSQQHTPPPTTPRPPALPPATGS